MTAIRIEQFGGIAPRYSDRLLPPQAAVIASNINLLSGELRGLHEPSLIKDLTAAGFTVRRAFRIPAVITAPVPMNLASDFWVSFTESAVDFVRSPVLGDSFERYYWTGQASPYSGVPKYNTRARILAASAAFRLGVPQPSPAPTVTPPAGANLTRAYVYTFVSAYGEEGQPSDPTLATGNAGTWALTNLDTTVPNSSERDVTLKRIYRTVPGFATTSFFFVAEIAVATASYNDNETDTTVAQNSLLESTTWAEPPATLQGLSVHPGGFLVGFSGRDLYMSEPFRPHAWPVNYILTAQTEIVGLAVFNNTIVVATNSHPYVADGVHPVSINFQKLDSVDPCVSQRSMATTLVGVMYASTQGLILIGSQGHQLVTHQLMTRQEWAARYTAAGIKAAPYGMQYIAFDTPQKGFIFSPQENLSPLTDVDRLTGVEGIQVDPYTGEVYVLKGNQVVLWDPIGTLPFSYQWRSKVFDLPAPVNFGALQVKFRGAVPGLLTTQQYQDFNTARIASPLNCINIAAVNAVSVEAISGWTGPQNKTPVGGSPLFNIAALAIPTAAVTIRVWARDQAGVMAEVFSFTATDEGVFRLPADFMSDVWQVELVANTDVYSFAMAETAKELRKA